VAAVEHLVQCTDEPRGVAAQQGLRKLLDLLAINDPQRIDHPIVGDRFRSGCHDLVEQAQAVANTAA